MQTARRKKEEKRNIIYVYIFKRENEDVNLK